ncbi:hypothetical protein CLD22_03805 [Rubrivivax gelatinosus]|nr:hypothetical protein [Rubrivivax gelatinosus]
MPDSISPQALATRIATLLGATLETEVDARRLLADPLYRRDVLLVCDAHVDHELAVLAARFRATIDGPPAPVPARGHGRGPTPLSRR